ncbi:hypothetical protein DU51_00615 [Methanosarcina mazei]|nr:hypothetical protein DU51_00615 [Methanosarcina mazei]
MGSGLKMVYGYTIGIKNVQIEEQITEAEIIENQIIELEMNVKRCDSMLKELIDKLNREVFDNYLEEVTDIDVDNFEKLNRKIRAITATRKILNFKLLGLMQKQ